jgi:hypothetical protein
MLIESGTGIPNCPSPVQTILLFGPQGRSRQNDAAFLRANDGDTGGRRPQIVFGAKKPAEGA